MQHSLTSSGPCRQEPEAVGKFNEPTLQYTTLHFTSLGCAALCAVAGSACTPRLHRTTTNQAIYIWVCKFFITSWTNIKKITQALFFSPIVCACVSSLISRLVVLLRERPRMCSAGRCVCPRGSVEQPVSPLLPPRAWRPWARWTLWCPRSRRCSTWRWMSQEASPTSRHWPITYTKYNIYKQQRGEGGGGRKEWGWELCVDYLPPASLVWHIYNKTKNKKNNWPKKKKKKENRTKKK